MTFLTEKEALERQERERRAEQALLDSFAAVTGSDTAHAAFTFNAEVSVFWVPGNSGRTIMPGHILEIAGTRTKVCRVESDLSGTKVYIAPVYIEALHPNQHEFRP